MATGALDANGIYQYGEDDSEPTFSGMLNKLASSTSTTVTRLEELSGLTAAQLTTHRDNLGVGLVNVAPTSVAQAGGSASANAQGLVTFTGVTSLSLNGIFTSAYDNYKVLVAVTSATATTAFRARLRASGTDNSVSYVWGGYGSSQSGTTTVWNGSTNGINLGDVTTGTTLALFSEITISKPIPAINTAFTFQTSYVNAAAYWGVQSAGRHLVDASYDGLTLFLAAAGNFSGTIQVFGYNN